ncbi:MAG: PAS domain S-box protein, partial [Chryseobacterium sp.]
YKPVKNSLKEVIGISIIANLFVVPETNVIQSEKRLRSLVQDGSDLIAILSSESICQYVSPTSKSILNINPSEFIGLNAFDFIHPEDREFAFAEFSRIGLEHRIQLQPFRFRHKDGNWRWVETIITDLRKDPSIMGIVSNSRDVTEKIVIQLALEKSHERYGYVSQATSDAIWDCDLRTQEVFWGEGFRTMFGYPNVMQLVEMTTWTQMIHPEDSDRIALSLNECIWGSNDKWSDEYRWRKSNGQYAYVIDKGFINRDDSGKAVRMVGAMRDITERKEEDLRLKLLESFVNQTNDAVTITESEIIDIGGPKIIYVNQAFSKMTGYTTQEVLGNSPGFLHGKKTSKEELKKLNKAVQNYEAVEITVINYRKNGEEFWMNFSATPIANEKGTY